MVISCELWRPRPGIFCQTSGKLPLGGLFHVSESREVEISVITSNISADFLTPPGVPTWEERKLLYAQVLRNAQPALIGLQEVTPRQLQFLRAQLPEFTALTVPVTDPDPDLLSTWQAKYARLGLPQIPSPYEIVLFYRTEVFDLLASDHWWLSPTPDRPLHRLRQRRPRVVLWARLQHCPSSREFMIFNTHIDHRCLRPMIELCREQLTAFVVRGLPLIFAGDFNFNPADANYASLIADGWRDSHDVAFATDEDTILYDLPGLPSGRIDHILYRGDGLTPQAWARLASRRHPIQCRERLTTTRCMFGLVSLNRLFFSGGLYPWTHLSFQNWSPNAISEGNSIWSF